MTIPILLCVDVEPDRREIDKDVPKDWRGFEQTFHYFKGLRSRLANATECPVHFSWFFRMDPQVALTYGNPAWPVQRYRTLVDEIESAGDEIGLHVHAFRWEESRKQWIADMANQDWVDNCVRMSFAAYQESFHRSCTSFRFGDHWMNNETMELIEELGARIDLTAEPGQKGFFIPGAFTGFTPDYSLVPREPYFPARSNFTRPGELQKRKIWVLPQSTGNVEWPVKAAEYQTVATSRTPSSKEPPKLDNDMTLKRRHSKPRYQGFLDRVDAQLISGWVYNVKRPNDPVDVEIYEGEVLLDVVSADRFRSDLLTAAKGNGKHSFVVLTPPRLRDGCSHTVRAIVAGSDYELNQSPKEMDRRPPHNGEELLLLNANPYFFKLGVDSLLERLKKPYLLLPVRSEVTLLPHEFSNVEQNIDFLASHALMRQFVFETPAAVKARFVGNRY